jgi:hypothetical protein
MHRQHPNYWKVQRTVSIIIISLISLLGLEALVYINNLYQPRLFILTSIYLYIGLVVWLHFIFDIHYKSELVGESFFHSIRLRFKHFFKPEYFFRFQNYMILPAVLYWGAVILIGINFGHDKFKLQQFIVVVTSLALVVAYSLFKEVFHTKLMPVNNNHFVFLTYAKLYASWLIYAASLGLVWYYCLPPYLFYVFTFLVTFMLLYQAVFQYCGLRLQYILIIFLISLALAAGSYSVYTIWNINYFSAALFMTAIYNFLWGLLFHYLKKTLGWIVFFEQLTIFILILIMVFGVTNFKARIDRC